MTHAGYHWHELLAPASLSIEPVVSFVRTLSTRPRRGPLQQSRPLVIEVCSVSGQLSWHLGLPPEEEQAVLRLLHAQLPDVRHAEMQSERATLEQAWELRTSSHRRPLRTDVPETVSASLLGALASTQQGESAVLQLIIGPWLPRRPVQVGPSSSVGQRGPLPAWNDWLVTSEQATALRAKQKEPVLAVVIRIGIMASSSRRRTLRQTVIGALQLVRTPGNGFERRLIPARWAASRLAALQTPLIAWPCSLSAPELASVLGLPVGSPIIPGVSYGGGRQLPAPEASLVSEERAARQHLRVMGEPTYPSQSGLVTQTMSDALRHTVITGPTGSGKSNFVGSLALIDILAGRGTVVIDMKGDLVTDLADRIPEEHLDRVVLMEPDSPAPVGFNVLQGRHPDVTVDLVVHVMSELYAGSWGPRTADVMTNGLTTLVRHGGLTLVELPVLLTNPQFRHRVLARIGGDDLGVGPFWQTFEGWSEGERAQVIGPSLNKLRALTNREISRRVVGQVQGFDLRSILAERYALLVNLSRGRLGSETAQLLGSLLVGALWSQIEQRSSVPPERRRSVAVYLDEFQQLLRLPTDLGDALAQSRGLGAALVLAHQDLSQLTPTVDFAVRNNCRTRITFASGEDDARVLARLLGGGLSPEDVRGLGQYETYQALCVGGVTARPSSVRTRPLPPSLGSLEAVRERSRRNYGQPGEAVDAELRERRRVTVAPTRIGVRRRGEQT